ncbi:MAG: hypothetical protein L6R39_000350 [Caloplaca ligustica]|nr:MAG: hypothetical protein L6R39_000350 [Caloplaca ligustica]
MGLLLEQEQTLQKIWVFPLSGCLLWLVYSLVYNLLFHPLCKFPGPKLAGATGLYEGYFDLIKRPGGQFVYEVERLHQVYGALSPRIFGANASSHDAGPIVRINPNELHINDISFFDELYAIGKTRDKDPQHIQIFGTPLSLFGSELHDVHKARRTAVNKLFSRSSVLHLEPLIQQRIGEMCDRISACAFDKCAGALKGADFSPEWEMMMSGVTEGVPLAKSLPGIVQVLERLPKNLMRQMNPLMSSFYDYRKVIGEHIACICTSYDSGPEDDSEKVGENRRNTIFHSLLRSSLPKPEKSKERLTQEAVGIVSAASETASLVLNTTTFHVLNDVTIMQRLRDELRTAKANKNGPLGWRDLEVLPFMTSVVKEGLRISTAISGRLPLRAPEVLRYGSFLIPAMTSVSMSPRDALLNPDIFLCPSKFDPDRWLRPVSNEQRDLMRKAFLPFNKGPRMCLGMNLAYANIFHNISALVMRFDLELVDTLRSRDVDMVRDHFVMKPTRGSKGVTVKVVKEYGFDEGRNY